MLDFSPHVLKVSCGQKHTLISTRDEVWATGNNTKGDLGQGNLSQVDGLVKVPFPRDIRIVDIQAGRHSAALSSEGHLFIWGAALNPKEPLMCPQELKTESRIKEI